jgi:hypothetical protein
MSVAEADSRIGGSLLKRAQIKAILRRYEQGVVSEDDALTARPSTLSSPPHAITLDETYQERKTCSRQIVSLEMAPLRRCPCMNLGPLERRLGDGLPMSVEGWFASGTTGEPTKCTVLDLSGAEVRLVIPAPADVPLEFELKIPSEGATAWGRLIWNSGNHYGARFI